MSSLTVTNINQPSARQVIAKNKHNPVSTSGYIALGGAITCGATGLRKVRIPHKMFLHRLAATVALAASIVHVGLINSWHFKKSH